VILILPPEEKPMLKNRQVIFHIKRYAMTNVYISTSEMDDLIDNLNPTEMKLYNLLKGSALINPSVNYFDSDNLAMLLKTTTNTINKSKSILKQKGYALIVRFRDESKEPMVRVIVGKDQVYLYNLGLKYEITNSKAFNRLLNKFPIMDNSLTVAQREEAVKEFNKYYLDHIEEFK